MIIWLTEIIDIDGIVWAGDRITAFTETHAKKILDTTGRGYMNIIGYLIAEVDYFEGKITHFDLHIAN